IRQLVSPRYSELSSAITAVLIFFFQAEDGIRDYKVTGVQTCALPIWGLRRSDGGVRGPAEGDRREARPRRGDRRRRRFHSGTARSEERRVGKECRYRWSPDH